jgi:hypothetical protein
MNFLKICLAVLSGFVLGALLYRPHPVKASMSGFQMTEVKPGYNSFIPGDQVIGFACTHDSCYIVAK